MQPVARCFIVSGASSGIGRACAKMLLLQGYTVIGLSRDSSKFTQPHPNFYGYQIDLADLKNLAGHFKALLKTYPNISGMILSAGQGRFASLEEFSYAQMQTLLDINLQSPIFTAKALLPHLKKQPLADLVFIGSEAALKGSRKGSLYCASKFGLRGFTQALRDECAKSSVRVALINPGMVKTAFFDDLSFSPGDAESQHLQATDVAEAVQYVINSRKGIIVDEINLNPANHVINFR